MQAEEVKLAAGDLNTEAGEWRIEMRVGLQSRGKAYLRKWGLGFRFGFACEYHRQKQAGMNGSKNVGTEEDGRDKKGIQTLWTLGVRFPQHRRAALPPPDTLPSPRSPWAAQGDSSRAALFTDPRNGC